MHVHESWTDSYIIVYTQRLHISAKYACVRQFIATNVHISSNPLYLGPLVTVELYQPSAAINCDNTMPV